MKALPMRVISAGVLALLSLAACGGGGGGDEADSGVAGYFSDAGFGPPTVSQADITNRQLYEFNTIVASDLVFLAPDGSIARFYPWCGGDECVVSVAGSTTRTNSADLDILAPDIAITPVMSGPGVHVARLRGRTGEGSAIHGYGAWMEYNAFSTGFVEAPDITAVNSGSGGLSNRTNPVGGTGDLAGDDGRDRLQRRGGEPQDGTGAGEARGRLHGRYR